MPESKVPDPEANEVSAGVFSDTTENNVAQSAEKTPYELLCGSLPPHALEYLRRLCKAGPAEARRFCRENALMEEAVVSDVNDLAYEYTNDIIIDNGNIIEDYLCDVSGALDKI